jgi:MerR family mercuric resistance operon transcriptional regulator
MDTTSRAKPLLIGNVSQLTGVAIETIRYYERVDLLPRPRRTEGRHRTFVERDVHRLSFIRRSRQLGFSLDDIRTLLELADRGAVACEETKELTTRHLADIRAKIRSLRKLERALQQMTAACRPGRQLSCPILDALGANG